MTEGPHYCIGDCRRAEAEIVRLRGEIDDLKYERDHWKREAGLLADSDTADALQTHFHLSDSEAAICSALYRRHDRYLPSETLEALLDEERGYSVESNVVSVLIGKIRQKLGEAAIENLRGRGYRLSAPIRARFDRKLKGKK